MIRTFLIALLTLCATWTRVEACSCVQLGPPGNLSPEAKAAWEREALQRRVTEQYDKAIAVFSGEVISGAIIEGGFGHVRIRRDKVWKGTLPEEFLMQNGTTRLPDGLIGSSSCDFELPLGGTFLIFAYGDSIASMRASKCGLSTTLSYATATIEVLDALVKERAGQIRRDVRQMKNHEPSRTVRAETSASEYPTSRKTSRVCSPSSGAARATTGGVSDILMAEPGV